MTGSEKSLPLRNGMFPPAPDRRGEHVRSVSITEARKQWSALVAHVISGNEVIITRRGKPIVRLVPCDRNESDHRSDR